MFIAPTAVLPHRPGDAPAREDRHLAPVVQPDPPREEQLRRLVDGVDLTAEPGLARRAPELECPAALEEEVALLGKHHREAGEVDLLLVHLHLREVGVDGEVGGQVGVDAVLRVEAAGGGPVVDHRRRADPITGHLRDAVGLELDGRGAPRTCRSGAVGWCRGGTRWRSTRRAAPSPSTGTPVPATITAITLAVMTKSPRTNPQTT